ncbi:RNA 2'-phosphotransferase [Curtobacterium sp. MCBD17_040]|uniref:RNA 2'-phosphotransferase n=1 Tax=Curtobacterium sp. MCBD17_040 TaxID=2175674 RepID=UPI0011B49BAA|nr:RNA 2'-phosphotransferase [Curtobacterium sp. MCBD17_040]WIB65899.1 RNA 2'-phosphotransferase [Curtobacterium sp. MCBD17_040]
MASSKDDVRLSRAMSRALRHAPEEYGLELAADGSVPLRDLVRGLRAAGRPDVTDADVRRVVAESDKQRYALDGNRIRAQYGHSVPERIRKREVLPDGPLWHATAPKLWPTIRDVGLLPMGRQYVHLINDPELALQAGRRKASWPLLLRIDTRRAVVDGVKFYEGHDQVTLADHVPGTFLAVVDPTER